MQCRSIRRSGQPTSASASLECVLSMGPDSRRALWPAVMRTAQVDPMKVARASYAVAIPNWRIFDVADSRCSFSCRVNYERTLVLAIEVSNKSWVLAAQVPGLPHTKAKRTVDPEAEALLAAIAGYRTRAAATGRSIERVIAVYEAGWSGFWLARWLIRRGVEVYVIQPSSVPVDRRMRRAKSDGIDAELLLSNTARLAARGAARVLDGAGSRRR